MDAVLDPGRKRNVGDEIVRPTVAVAIRPPADLGNDAAGLRKSGPRLAKAQAPQRWTIVEHHEPGEKRRARGAKAMTRNDAGLL